MWYLPLGTWRWWPNGTGNKYILAIFAISVPVLYEKVVAHYTYCLIFEPLFPLIALKCCTSSNTKDPCLPSGFLKHLPVWSLHAMFLLNFPLWKPLWWEVWSARWGPSRNWCSVNTSSHLYLLRNWAQLNQKHLQQRHPRWCFTPSLVLTSEGMNTEHKHYLSSACFWH